MPPVGGDREPVPARLHPGRGALSGRSARAALLGAFTLAAGCALLPRQLVEAPRFHGIAERPSELRLLGPSRTHPLGGLQVRLWTRIENPNAFGLTIAGLAGQLHLQERHAATVDLPMGLPLPAQRDTIVPIDVSLGFADVPGLADALVGAVTGQRLSYRLDGVVTVDAGALGRPSFGPATVLRGETVVTR